MSLNEIFLLPATSFSYLHMLSEPLSKKYLIASGKILKISPSAENWAGIKIFVMAEN